MTDAAATFRPGSAGSADGGGGALTTPEKQSSGLGVDSAR
jgi:hypothetical protein